MEEESKYVLRSEWIDSNGKIYERINMDKIEYNSKVSDLSNRIERQTDIAQRQLDSLERQEKNLEKQEGHAAKLEDVMDKLADDFVDIKYKVQNHSDKIKGFEGLIASKQQGNLQLTGIIVGAVVSVIVAAIGFAQVFF